MKKLFELFLIISAASLLVNCIGSIKNLNNIKSPVQINSVQPVYPKTAIDRGIEGIVGLKLYIDTLGNVAKTVQNKSSGWKVLDEAAFEYSQKLKFLPAEKNGKRVPTWITWNVKFDPATMNSTQIKKSNFSIMIFSKRNGFVHKSVDEGIKLIKKLSEDYNFKVIFTEDSTYFSKKNLDLFDAVVFLNTSGDILGTEEQSAFESYIHNGGGFVGIHGASATEYDWEWYGKLVGAFFDEHPEQQKAKVSTINQYHISTRHLPQEFEWFDEWYNWRTEPSENLEVLLTVDESTYEGGKHGEFHPVSWCHEFEGGRSWYTSLGHRKDHYSNEYFAKHILGGIFWAVNKEYKRVR